MALWTYWPGDALPDLAPVSGLGAAARTSTAELTNLTGLTADEAAARLGAGHRCYVARLAGVPVAYGWVARVGASIGELDLTFGLSGSDRYLWDFVTLPAWRGRGVYPHLLQGILRAEGLAEHRSWIINAPENTASARGIARAGFVDVGDLAFTRQGRVAISRLGTTDRAAVGAALLGVPLVVPGADPGVSPCWTCVTDALARGSGGASCWSGEALAALACTCGVPAMAGNVGAVLDQTPIDPYK
jgi:GNAT superfamily N-acetyltransferase